MTPYNRCLESSSVYILAFSSNNLPYSHKFINLINLRLFSSHGPLARYVKLRVAHAPGMPGTFSPPPRVSDPDIRHVTCVTHVQWCMPGSLSAFEVGGGENVPDIPGARATRTFTYLARGIWTVSIYSLVSFISFERLVRIQLTLFCLEEEHEFPNLSATLAQWQ